MFTIQNQTVAIAHLMDDPYIPKGQWKKCIGRIPLGMAVRGSWAKNRTFRVRRGNGYYGAVAGKLYQDRYRYVVPSSINNVNGQPARDAMIQANYNWYNVLTQAQRDNYNRIAKHGLSMSGRNKYIGEFIKGNTVVANLPVTPLIYSWAFKTRLAGGAKFQLLRKDVRQEGQNNFTPFSNWFFQG